jgi:ubiquinone/menaquinone biosynthesis C-methylase UbiE
MDDWRSYDLVARTYEDVHARLLADPARDLVTLTGVAAGDRVLDVGTGTGIAAEAAANAGGRPIGIDASVGMLAVAREHRPNIPVAAAHAIDLPFADGAFDAVLANFVLAHFAKVDTALFELIRVTRPEGTLGFTSWADGPDAFTETWTELVAAVVPNDLLEPTMAKAIPNHERFRRREGVEQALHDAGLRHVRTELVRYEWRYDRDAYVDGLGVWATGRFVREMLGEEGWAHFLERAKARFAQRFPDLLHDSREVIVAAGIRD